MVNPEIVKLEIKTQPISHSWTFSESKQDCEEKLGVPQLQAGLLVGGESEGDADQSVDVVAGQQGQGGQLVLSESKIFRFEETPVQLQQTLSYLIAVYKL